MTLIEAARAAAIVMDTYPVTVKHWQLVLKPAADRLRAALAAAEAQPHASLLDKFIAAAEESGRKTIHDLPGLIPALQATESQPVPTGFKLVPVEPTNDMIHAGDDDKDIGACATRVYRTMLAAAPAAPAQAPQSKRDRDACADGAEFQLWWAAHMPHAMQSDAWAEWCAIRSNHPPAHAPTTLNMTRASTTEATTEARKVLQEFFPSQPVQEPVAHAHVYGDTNSFNDDDAVMRVRVVFVDPNWQYKQRDGATVSLYTAPAKAPQDDELQRLRSTMIAAAEEIQAHWDAHCDSEGYGPVNLMHRLEHGIASEYGYTAGSFTKMQDELQRLRSDAERYRKLRNRLRAEVLGFSGPDAGCWIDGEDDSGTLVLLTGDDADSAVDAMAAPGIKT